MDFQRVFAEELPALLLYYPVYTYGVRDKIHDVQMGPLNTPGDRYRSIADWYIVTKRSRSSKYAAHRLDSDRSSNGINQPTTEEPSRSGGMADALGSGPSEDYPS